MTTPEPFNHDAVIIRTTDALGRAHRGFQYPLDVEPGFIMVCPDWHDRPECGGGFHGLLDGLGNYGLLKNPGDQDAIWWIWGVLKSEAVFIGDEKVKVPRMKLIYKGSFGGAMAMVSLPLAQAIASKVKQITTGATKKVKGGHTSRDGGASSATGSRGASSATGYGGASSATGDGGASSATGSRGASSATGYGGASSATGYGGASSATGYGGASSATGDGGASSATGSRGGAISLGWESRASAEGAHSIAVSAGRNGRGMVGETGVLVLIERDDENRVIGTFIAQAGKKGIKPGKWYRLVGGKPQEVK